VNDDQTIESANFAVDGADAIEVVRPTDTAEKLVARAIDNAEELLDDPVAMPVRQKPRLLVEHASPDRTVAALRDILAAKGSLSERGVPVRLAFDATQRGILAQVMTPDTLVLMTHAVCRPYVLKVTPERSAIEVDARLPRSLAAMYLDWRGEWRLPPLNGIASAPLLRDDGSIASGEGYDAVSGMWCENVPDL
jgi:hypothetical protein